MNKKINFYVFKVTGYGSPDSIGQQQLFVKTSVSNKSCCFCVYYEKEGLRLPNKDTEEWKKSFSLLRKFINTIGIDCKQGLMEFKFHFNQETSTEGVYWVDKQWTGHIWATNVFRLIQPLTPSEMSFVLALQKEMIG
ncbi:MAG: hypothetical protein WC606_03375 [Candidatus Absconditabacterales bacterium]|jgi:hypothetical protein